MRFLFNNKHCNKIFNDTFFRIKVKENNKLALNMAPFLIGDPAVMGIELLAVLVI